QIQRKRERERRDPRVLFEPGGFGRAREVAHDGVGGLERVVARVVQETADGRGVDAADGWAVRMALASRGLVVANGVPRPPQRSFLHRRGPDQRPDEARAAVHLERSMGEVAMERERQADGPKKM